ncbi:MAG TPA: DinB family protein [Bryobacteraceae bacterium]|nr:DinB family protein [Bryobacteraceae bacterium]
MTRTILMTASLFLAATVSVAAAATSQGVTQAEKEQTLRYLAETRNGIVDAVKGLSEAQWKFKPAPDRWSVAEIVEHLALIEDVVSQNILANIEKAPAPSADRDPKQVDAMLLAKVPDRSTKFQAPPAAVPTGRWTPAETLEHFLASRAQTVALFKSTPDLRDHALNHPVFGPLDGYEWVLAVAAHSARHTKQILEVKADPNFPAN